MQDTKLIGRSAANLEIDINSTESTLTYTVGTESTTISVESLDSLSNHFYIAIPGTRLYCVRVYNRLLSVAENPPTMKWTNYAFRSNGAQILP